MGSDYKVIEVVQVDSQNPPGGEPWISNTYVGSVWYATFTLPDVAIDQPSILSYRVMRNVTPNKLICFNDVHVPGGLPTHPSAPLEWFSDIVHVPKDTLVVGHNVFCAGYTTTTFDEFQLQSVSLWYELTNGSSVTIASMSSAVTKQANARNSVKKRGRK